MKERPRVFVKKERMHTNREFVSLSFFEQCVDLRIEFRFTHRIYPQCGFEKHAGCTELDGKTESFWLQSNGRIGWFPSNYVEEMGSSVFDTPAPSNGRAGIFISYGNKEF